MLNRLAKTSTGEVDLASQALGLVIAEPVLQQRCVERCWAQAVEAEALACVHHGELSGQRQHGALGGRVGQLWGGTANQCNDGRRVDDATLCLLVTAQGQNGVLGAEPDALDVDVHGQVPNVLWRANSIVVLGVHDACVVEDDVQTTVGVEGLNHGGNLGLLGDIAQGGRHAVLGSGDELEELGLGLFESWGGNVGHKDAGALLGEEDGGFKTDATGMYCQLKLLDARPLVKALTQQRR